LHPARETAPILSRSIDQNLQPYAAVRLLSLDVSFGALAGGAMVARFLSQAMHPSWYVVLPLAVWVVYTWDHLLDAHRMGNRASTIRHRFHATHFRSLFGATVLGAAVATLLAARFLGTTGVLFGIGMAGFAFGHFVFIRFVGRRTSPFLVKELGVGLVYSFGIWGLPLLNSSTSTSTVVVWIAAGQFLLLAFANLIEFSIFERDIDKADGHTSWVLALGTRRSIRVVWAVLVSAVLLGVGVLFTYGGAPLWRLQLTYLAMTLILSALLLRHDWFARQERYRAWGDGAFLLPLIYLLLP